MKLKNELTMLNYAYGSWVQQTKSIIWCSEYGYLEIADLPLVEK